LKAEFRNVHAVFGIAMIFIISPIHISMENAGTVLGFVVVEVWYKLLEIVIDTYQ
jgi:hypothetical protein